MGVDKKLKATWKVKHSTNNLAKNYEVPITNEQLSIFHLICNFLLISACRLATSTDSFTDASQKFPFFFQNRHLLEDFKKAPSDTLGLSPKEIYLVTVFRVSNYGNSIGTFVRVLLKITWINGFCRWTNLLQSDANKSKLLQVHRWSKYFLLKWESWQFCVSTLFCWSALAEVY